MYGEQKHGYGVYKKHQVSIGNPFAVQPPTEKSTVSKPTANGLEEDGGFVPVDVLEKARRDAMRIIKEAEKEASRLLEEARDTMLAEAGEIARKAREEGYKEGEHQAQKQYEYVIAEAENLQEMARTEYRNTMSRLEGDIIELVLDVARKAVGHAVLTDPDSILAIIRTTLDDVTPTGNVTIKVSAEDYEHVQINRERLAASLSFLCDLSIKRDSSLRRGSCIVETGRGTVDGSADTRLKQIEDAFHAMLLGRPNTPINGLSASSDASQQGEQ